MTKYSKLEEMRDHLLTYLKEQKQFLQEDIDASSQLTDDEKIDNGLLIVDATVLRHEDNEYLLSAGIQSQQYKGKTRRRSDSRVIRWSKVNCLCH